MRRIEWVQYTACNIGRQPPPPRTPLELHSVCKSGQGGSDIRRATSRGIIGWREQLFRRAGRQSGLWQCVMVLV